MSTSRTLHCRRVTGGRFRLLNHIRDLPPIILDEPGGLPVLNPTPQPLDVLLPALGSCLASATMHGIAISGRELDVEADVSVP